MAGAGLLEQIPVGITKTDRAGRYLYANPFFCQFTGYTGIEILQLRCHDLIYSEDLEAILEHEQRLRSGEVGSFSLEKRLVTRDGQIKWVSWVLSLARSGSEDTPFTLSVIQDITARKRHQLDLQRHHQQQQLIYRITQQIRRSLDLDHILETSVDQIRGVLGIDRVVFYQFEPDGSGAVVAESVAPGWTSLLGRQLFDPCLAEESGIVPYRHGKIQRTVDLETAGLSESYVQLLTQFQVKANLVVPILAGETLWGLIVAQHCSSPRFWLDAEVDLIKQLSEAIAIGIQQGQLYQQTQQLNQTLEQQVQVRTQQLQQMVRFEALVRRITERVRQSLNQDEILTTVVSELAAELQTTGCNTTLFDQEINQGQVSHDQGSVPLGPEHRLFRTDSYPELFHQIAAGWTVQLCHLDPNLPRPYQTCLICAIADNQGVIAALWLNRPAQETFTISEIDLVQQVASQCGIGLRQSYLFQASQRQVVALEQLNLLKDDFLSTVSHELRSPLANIRMALHMMTLTPSAAKRQQYYTMAVSECSRQSHLIEDLLSLQQLEAGAYTSQLTLVDLQELIQKLIPLLHPQIPAKEQQLELLLPNSLDPILTDPLALERILRELLENAHKHSNPEAAIQFEISTQAHGIQFRISNMGQLPPQELPRLFDKFYRVPRTDRWRQGGTGLGLALVQGLIEILHGKLWVTQDSGWVHFNCWIPTEAAADSTGANSLARRG